MGSKKYGKYKEFNMVSDTDLFVYYSYLESKSLITENEWLKSIMILLGLGGRRKDAEDAVALLLV